MSHRGRGVERLGDGDEGDPTAVEDLDDPGKIGKGAGQPVDLVDDDDVNAPGFAVGEQALQGRALQGAAGHAAIVVPGGQRDPAFLLLAGDIRRAGVALGLQGVEVLLEALCRRLARIEGAANRGGSPPRRCPLLSHGRPAVAPALLPRLQAAGRRSGDRTGARR